MRFLAELSTPPSLFGGSGGRFTLNDGSFGREARRPRTRLAGLSNGLGPMVEATPPEFDGRPTVAGGCSYIGRFREELAVVAADPYE